MRHQPFEHHTPSLVRIEAEIEEIVEVAAALRRAEGDGTVDPAGKNVGRSARIRRVVAQERDEVAGRSETEPHDPRILGLVDELVDRAAVEAFRPSDRDLVWRLELE